MKPLEFPVLSFDTETTSEKPQTCRVCQVAAILLDAEPERPDMLRMQPIMSEICDPGLASSDGATAIHGIGPEQWAGKRKDEEALRELHTYIADNYRDDDGYKFVLSGHNVRWFDLVILWRVSGLPPIFGLPVIDTMICAQRIYPLAPSHRLTTNPKEPAKTGLIEWLNLGPVEGAHSAEGDALMVYRLVQHFCEGLGLTPMQLASWCSETRLLKYCAFGKHKGKLWGKYDPSKPEFAGRTADEYVPSGYAWFIAKEFDPTPDLAVTIKHHYGYRFAKPVRE